MSRNILSLIIDYAYTGSVFITEEVVLELLVAADQFLVSGLVDACCQFLDSHLCLENCIGICMFTEDFHSCSKLRQKAQLYTLQHFEEVLQVSEEFLELSLEQLEEIIEKDELNVKQEEVVFEAMLHWIDYAPESRRKHIAVLLSKVRQRNFVFLVCLVVHYKYLKSLKSGYIYFKRYFRYEVLRIKQCKLLTKLSLFLKQEIFYHFYQYFELVFILVFGLI